MLFPYGDWFVGLRYDVWFAIISSQDLQRAHGSDHVHNYPDSLKSVLSYLIYIISILSYYLNNYVNIEDEDIRRILDGFTHCNHTMNFIHVLYAMASTSRIA